jgi:hypothetical protein
MTDKNTAALIIVALIGAIGVILAACIGLIPTILPMVRPTFTPNVLFSATFTPSNTPLPETPSATSAPTDIPTSTATLQPLETPTDTPTTVPTLAASSSNIDDYVGIWINVDSEPASDRVKLVITRVDVSKTGDTTANLVVCQHTQDGAIAVLPNPAPGLLYDFALVARDLSIPSEPNFKWTVLLQQSGKRVVATVLEFDGNNILQNSDTFRLEEPNLLGAITLQPCETPSTPSP